MHRFIVGILSVCLPAACITLSGCGDSSKARKLQPPEDVDWEALEKEESAMNAGMNDPANKEN